MEPQGGRLRPPQLAGREGLEGTNLCTTYSTNHILDYREIQETFWVLVNSFQAKLTEQKKKKSKKLRISDSLWGEV